MSPDYDYSTPIIEYNNNKEYRAYIRKIFRMDVDKMKSDLEKTYDISQMDEETYDELLYDNDKMFSVLNDLYVLTKKNKLFKELYDLAAAKMFSTLREIGQSILFSYGYLYLFHPCMCVFLQSPSEFTVECPYYTQLKDKLQER
jgi:hypothetical protein